MSHSNLVRLRNIVRTADGRDKLFKTIQYTLKLLVLTATAPHKRPSSSALSFFWSLLISTRLVSGPRPIAATTATSKTAAIDPKNAQSIEKAQQLAKQLGLTRKMLRFGHWFEGLCELQKLNYKTEFIPYLYECIGVLNDLVDDVVCLEALKVVEAPWSAPLSDRLWFMTIIYDLSELKPWTKKAWSKSKNARKIIKLSADFGFCSIDVFHLHDKFPPTMQAYLGLVAALLGSYSIWEKSATE